MDSSSHGANGGAFHPSVPAALSNRTCAPYGGSLSSSRRMASTARVASTVGGKRKESLNASSGSNTLPAETTGGRPSAPVTASVGRHELLMSSSTGSLE